MVKLRKIRITFSILGVFCLLFYGSFAAKGTSEEAVNEEIRDLNKEIGENRQLMEKLDKRKQEYAKAISQKREEAKTLANELSIIDNRIAKAEIEISNTEAQVKEVDLEIKKTSLEIGAKTDKMEKEKRDIANILKLIYRENDVSALEILLLNNSLADFLNHVKYLEDINKEIGESLEELKMIKADLEQKKAELDSKNENLIKLKEELKRNKLAFEDEKKNKNFILDETKSSEQEYQSLLSAAKKEQDGAAAEIASLEKTVRDKMASLNKNKIQRSEGGLVWPVSGRYITSYFHDPEYPFRNVYEHPAVDIRSSQGSPVYSADAGYVAKVKLQGTAYGYIMIIHGDGLSTVYGHVSKSMVSEEDYVAQGQVIALSGGLPGTTGAGRMTTGPHLHFEVRKDGLPVNPLEYLP